MRVVVLAVAIAFGIASNTPHKAWGSDDVATRSLRGIGAINVVVVDLPESAQRSGLNSAAIRASVELRLRRNGVTLDSKSPRVLRISLNTLENAPVASWVTEVAMTQVVAVDRTKEAVVATTWESTQLGLCGARLVRGQVQDALDVSVDIFSNDYLAANEQVEAGAGR